MLSVVLIYILTGVLLYEAVQRTVHQDFSIDGDIMLITAAVGVAVNLMYVKPLDYYTKPFKNMQSLNIRFLYKIKLYKCYIIKSLYNI